MAVTRSTSLKKKRSFVAATIKVAAQAKPKQTKKPKKTPKKAAVVKATPKTAIVKVPVVTQPKDSSATDTQLPMQMISIPTDVIYSLNNTRMQHFIVDVKDEVDTFIGTLSQPFPDSIGQDPPRRDSTAYLKESSDSGSAVKFVEQIPPANEMNVRYCKDLEDFGIPKVKPSSPSRVASKLDENTIQYNDTNIDSLTVVQDPSQCNLEAVVKEEILSTNEFESFSESVSYSRESRSEKSPVAAVSTILKASFPELVASLPGPSRIKENSQKDRQEDFPDFLSDISDGSMLSLENPTVNGTDNLQYHSSSPNDSSHVFELPSISSRREISCTDLFQSPNCPKNISSPEPMEISDGLEEGPLHVTDIQKHFTLEHFLSNDHNNCPSPTKIIIQSALSGECLSKGDFEDECPSPTRTLIKGDFDDECPSPTRTLIKDDLDDECPSPTRTLIKGDLEDECPSRTRTLIKDYLSHECPSPTRTIIKCDLKDECPSPTRTIIKSESESEDWCSSPTGIIIKDECYSPTSTASINMKITVDYLERTNNILPEYRPSCRNRRNSKRGAEVVQDNSSFDRPLDKPENSSLKERFKTARRHQNSFFRDEQMSDLRYIATNRLSSPTVFPANQRTNNKLSDGSFKERMTKRKRGDCEINSEGDSESDIQRGKMKRYSCKGNSTTGSRGFQSEWPHMTYRIENDITDDSATDYGWEDPPPPKPKAESSKEKSIEVDPVIHEKMQMFMGKLNNEYDLDVIQASRKELFEAIEESIAVQSTKKLNELDQKIRKKKDDYVLNLFGTGDFESWNNDAALSNVSGIGKLKPYKSPTTADDASLLDKMTMNHLEKET